MAYQMLEFLEDLGKKYKYKLLPKDLIEDTFEFYVTQLPDEFKTAIRKCKMGYEVKGQKCNITTLDGTELAKGYDRIVIGHYGAFLEINESDLVLSNIIIKPGEEYRIEDEHFRNSVKYFWFTTADRCQPKLYFQQKEVIYADYKVGKWYISPYETKLVKAN